MLLFFNSTNSNDTNWLGKRTYTERNSVAFEFYSEVTNEKIYKAVYIQTYIIGLGIRNIHAKYRNNGSRHVALIVRG